MRNRSFRGKLEPDDVEAGFEAIAMRALRITPPPVATTRPARGRVPRGVRFRLAKGLPALGLNPLVDVLAVGHDQAFVHVHERRWHCSARASLPALARSAKTNEGDICFLIHWLVLQENAERQHEQYRFHFRNEAQEQP